MRTRHTSTLASLRARARCQAERVPLSHATRPLATTSARQLPRLARASVRNASSGTTTPAPAAPPVEPPAETAEIVDADPDAGGEEPGPAAPSFPAIVTTLTAPAPPTDPLPTEHHVLFNHLATSFLPSNQPCLSPPLPERPPSIMAMNMHSHMQPGRKKKDDAAAATQSEDPVVALVCPFEGGDAYVSRAVNEVAAHLSADVVRIDLALAVGFDGAYAPLAETGLQAPALSQSTNPLFQSPAVTDQQSPQHEEDAEGDEGENGMPNMIRIPMFTANMSGGMPGMPVPPGMFGGPGQGGQASDDSEEWTSFFNGLLNIQLPEGEAAPAKRRIILLESTAAMAETFEVWWPSLLEAVRQRRRGPTPKGKGKRAPTTTTYPTTIVLSAPPSLLLPHTAPAAEPGMDGSHSVEENKERIRSVVEALGANVSAIHVDGGDKGEEKIWWSSEEHDHEGRMRREDRRLRTMLQQGPTALLPFSAAQSNQNANASPHPLLDMLMGRNRQKEDGTNSSLVWKTLPIIPATRDTALEQYERTRRRRAVNAALMMRAVGQLGATLEEPLAMLDAPSSVPPRGRERRLKRRKEPDPEWSEYVIAWKDAVDLASTAVGRAATTGDDVKGPLKLTWTDIQLARAVTFDYERHVDETVQQYITASDIATSHRERRAAPEPTVADPVVEAVKKAKDLSKHEKRLLGCIVDPTKLATSSFKDVHLPYKTIDAIRSVISLPLLFPEAFQGGILKDHVTSGALLFGPPGTGKTLLARAIAAESGARMLAIQPSDVNDMWVGEGEKLVKAVFNLARRLSPCVVFIDEVDSLFGARSARDSGGGSKAHNQILTEFMQEMDGLSSANANREKRIVVMGATNRPFDLDDAVLRRLPRRLLVDLPTAEDRKAILEILLRDESLADSVDLGKLAAETEGFSGSDLKHLCVAAALAAVKDIVKVPWKAGPTAVPPPGQAPPPSHPSGGHREAVALDVAPEEPEVAEKVPVAELSPAAQLVEQTYLRQLEARAQDESAEAAAAAAASKGEVESTDAPDGQDRAVPEASNSDAPSTPAEAAPAAPAPMPKRTLTAKHFTIALGEIRPSSSEEGTLPELRKWAELYGEGGKEKGKKSGFGKGFGFGEEPLGKRRGYGRVGEDKE